MDNFRHLNSVMKRMKIALMGIVFKLIQYLFALTQALVEYLFELCFKGTLHRTCYPQIYNGMP